MASIDKQLDGLRGEIERLDAQLGICGVVALGNKNNLPTKGDFLWSPAFHFVLELRYKYEALIADTHADFELLMLEGLVELHRAASGINQAQPQIWDRMAEAIDKLKSLLQKRDVEAEGGETSGTDAG